MLNSGGIPWSSMATAFLLTLVWMSATGMYFAHTLNYVRSKGYLTTSARG